MRHVGYLFKDNSDTFLPQSCARCYVTELIDGPRVDDNISRRAQRMIDA